jgi:DNA-binding MarR family transcriptional regulator
MSKTSSVEIRNFVKAVLSTQNAVLKHGDIATGLYGQTSARWRVMLLVTSDDMTVSAVAKESGVSRQAVQRIVDNLVKDGLASYSKSNTDKRTQTIALTNNGKITFDKLEQSFDSWSERLVSEISSETLSLLTQQLDSVRLTVEKDILNFEKGAN